MHGHEQITERLINILSVEPEIKHLLESSIAGAAEINPDRRTNPVRSLEDYFTFVDRCSAAMPWDILDGTGDDGIYDRVDQGLNYFYFLNDVPLPELGGRGLYNCSVQYVGSYRNWLAEFVRGWGLFLSTPQSWGPRQLELVRSESRFGLDRGWYEPPENWNSFNDFFSRRLSSPAVRPICAVNNCDVVCSPADSAVQGIWNIDENSKILCDGEHNVKSRDFGSVIDLLGPKCAYRREFAGGCLTHSFLDVHDYHRFHFPVSGTVLEVTRTCQECASGGRMRWDTKQKKYILDSRLPGWQMTETRGCVIADMGDRGLAALMPVGMSQVSSVNFEANVRPGLRFEKGNALGWFLFGGSDFVMLFQRKAGFHLTSAPGQHLLMGGRLGEMG